MGTGTKIILAAAGLYAAAWAYKGATVTLHYLKQTDFGPWFPLMNPDLLRKLDRFVQRIEIEGGTAYVSPASGALGRHLGSSDSQHNVDKWGNVNAADLMVEGVSLQRAYEIARDIGFSGIGVYPDWDPAPGVHLDVRSGRRPSEPALWAGVDAPDGGQDYVGITQVIAA